MSEPLIAAFHSAKLDLKAGTYFWCACGRSTNQPFCDGSHKVTTFTPLKFELADDKKVSLCLCKHTKTPPYCDGTHKSLNK